MSENIRNKDSFTILENCKKLPFQAPESYFEQANRQIIDKNVSALFADTSVRDQEKIFRLPYGYFDWLSASLVYKTRAITRVNESKKTLALPIPLWLKLSNYSGFALCLTLFVTSWYINQKQIEKPANLANIEQMIGKIPKEQAIYFLEQENNIDYIQDLAYSLAKKNRLPEVQYHQKQIPEASQLEDESEIYL